MQILYRDLFFNPTGEMSLLYIEKLRNNNLFQNLRQKDIFRNGKYFIKVFILMKQPFRVRVPFPTFTGVRSNTFEANNLSSSQYRPWVQRTVVCASGGLIQLNQSLSQRLRPFLCHLLQSPESNSLCVCGSRKVADVFCSQVFWIV